MTRRSTKCFCHNGDRRYLRGFLRRQGRPGLPALAFLDGNPLACRAALATLEIFEQQDVLARNVGLARLLELAGGARAGRARGDAG